LFPDKNISRLVAGVLDVLVDMVQNASTAGAQASALLCLSELAFSNFDVKYRIYHTPGLLPSLATILHTIAGRTSSAIPTDSLEQFRDENSFWLLNALSSQLWDEHDHIIELFFNDALTILRAPYQVGCVSRQSVIPKTKNEFSFFFFVCVVLFLFACAHVHYLTATGTSVLFC
jgi:hypothetical protein